MQLPEAHEYSQISSNNVVHSGTKFRYLTNMCMCSISSWPYRHTQVFKPVVKGSTKVSHHHGSNTHKGQSGCMSFT